MTAEHRRDRQNVLTPPPLMGYVEGFIATTNEKPIEGHPPFTRDRLEELRNHVLDQPWLYSPHQERGEPLGRVAWGEVVPVGNGFGLWARVEFFRREALQLTSAGILGLLSFPSGSPTTSA